VCLFVNTQFCIETNHILIYSGTSVLKGSITVLYCFFGLTTHSVGVFSCMLSALMWKTYLLCHVNFHYLVFYIGFCIVHSQCAFNFSAGKLACRHMFLPVSDSTVLAHCRKLRQRHSAKAWRKTWSLYQGNHCYLEDSTGHLSLLLCQLHIMFSILGSYRGHIL
jgi:hypothetical protein